MRKAWKKAVSVLLTLVLIFGVLPAMNVSAEGEGGQGSGNSVEITLDNGTYNDTYKNKYGTIQYSTNYRDNSTSAEWKEISELTASDNQGKSKYTIQGENVYIKITYAQGSTYKAAIPNGVEVFRLKLQAVILSLQTLPQVVEVRVAIRHSQQG